MRSCWHGSSSAGVSELSVRRQCDSNMTKSFSKKIFARICWSVERLAPVHSKQLLTYIRLMRLHVGLLINFGGATLKEALHRIVNALAPSASPRLRVNR